MKVSGALIVKNEERCLKRCLDSYRHITEEIIVVDTGSTDRTVEIAEECGAKVYHFEWIDDFAAARNYALEQCTGDWIILLDADEWFPEGQADNLLKVLNRYHGDRRLHAATMYMENIDPERIKRGEIKANSVHQSLRAMRNLRGLRYKGRIHEMLFLDDGTKNINTIQIDRALVTLLHDGYRAEILEEKGQRNIESNLKTWEETKNPDYLHYAAMDLCNLNRHEEALKYFNMYFDTGHFSHYFGTYPHKLAINAMRILEYPEEEVRDFIFQTAEKYPGNAGAQYFKAEYYRLHHEYDKAYPLFEKVDNLLGPKPEKYLDFGFTIGKDNYPRMFCDMADMHMLRGNNEKAFELLERVLRWRRDYEPAIKSLIWLLRFNTPEDTVAYWQKWYSFENLDDIKLLLKSYLLRKPGLEFLLLFEKYFALTGEQDVYFFTMLLLIEEYRKAFTALSARHIISGAPNYGMKALMASYLGGHLEWNAEYDEHTSKVFKSLVNALRDGTTLEEEQYGHYIIFISELIKYIQPGDERLLPALQPVLGVNTVDKMPFIDLLQQSDHDDATRYLLDSIGDDEADEVRVQKYRILTMLEYKLGDYAAARDAIAKARAIGGDTNLCDTYERWMEENEADA